MAALVGSVIIRKRCFIFHRENIQMLVISICDSSSSGNDSDSDLTDTSELAQPLSEYNNSEVCHFFGMDSNIKCVTRV
jgi:hypothetical protein